MKGTPIPCNDTWYFVGKGIQDEAIIFQVALWAQSEDGLISGLIGEISSNGGSLGSPPNCKESGYYPVRSLTSNAIEKCYRGETLPYKEAFKRFSTPTEVKPSPH